MWGSLLIFLMFMWHMTDWCATISPSRLSQPALSTSTTSRLMSRNVASPSRAGSTQVRHHLPDMCYTLNVDFSTIPRHSICPEYYCFINFHHVMLNKHFESDDLILSNQIYWNSHFVCSVEILFHAFAAASFYVLRSLLLLAPLQQLKCI